jgi:hypothetical protein
MFGLFFERPELNAPFWIVMAIGWRLTECQWVAPAWRRPEARHARSSSIV